MPGPESLRVGHSYVEVLPFHSTVCDTCHQESGQGEVENDDRNRDKDGSRGETGKLRLTHVGQAHGYRPKIPVL